MKLTAGQIEKAQSVAWKQCGFKPIPETLEVLAEHLQYFRPSAPSPRSGAPVLSHLVHKGEGRTLCGLTEWEAGNVDIKFGIEKGVTTCAGCLRVAYTEKLTAAVNVVLADRGLVTLDAAFGPVSEEEWDEFRKLKYWCDSASLNEFLTNRRKRLSEQEPERVTVKLVSGSWAIFLDGEYWGYSDTQAKANICAAGLRLDLDGGAK